MNLLTFDIEDWYHANYRKLDKKEKERLLSQNGSNFSSNTEKLLEICKLTGARGTFFVLGEVAKQFPEVIRKIHQEGHEIASHGYAHELAYEQSYESFKADVELSIDLLEDITGEKIKGYRAPSWSIRKDNLHYLAALVELGLQYDASIFPVKTFLYGIPDATRSIHRLDFEQGSLWEVPMSVIELFGRAFGFTGGFYLRFWPEWLIRFWGKQVRKKDKPVIYYLHPREINPKDPHMPGMKPLEMFIHYYNLKGTQAKLARLLQTGPHVGISEYLTNYTAENERRENLVR